MMIYLIAKSNPKEKKLPAGQDDRCRQMNRQTERVILIYPLNLVHKEYNFILMGSITK